MIAAAPRQGDFGPESKLFRPKQHHFRGSLGRFATGVAVVTFDTSTGSAQRTSTGSVQAAARRHGITVNSFTSVSMDPPLVLVSIARTTNAHDELAGRSFTVNILGAEQEALAERFSGKQSAEKPGTEPQWVEWKTAPRLSGALSYFQCTPWAAYDGGDHTLYLGEVQEFDYRSGDALGFVNGRYTPIPEYLLGHEALL